MLQAGNQSGLRRAIFQLGGRPSLLPGACNNMPSSWKVIIIMVSKLFLKGCLIFPLLLFNKNLHPEVPGGQPEWLQRLILFNLFTPKSGKQKIWFLYKIWIGWRLDWNFPKEKHSSKYKPTNKTRRLLWWTKVWSFPYSLWGPSLSCHQPKQNVLILVWVMLTCHEVSTICIYKTKYVRQQLVEVRRLRWVSGKLIRKRLQ